jgi:hypothetical protein
VTTADPKSAIAVIVAGLAVIAAGPVLASNWSNPLASASAGEAQAVALPVAPAGLAAACVSATGSKITVIWIAVSHASSYTIYDSTTSATSGYSVVLSGVTGTSWTSGSLASGNYWFEVSSSVGTNWSGPSSGTSGETTVVKNNSCVQP